MPRMLASLGSPNQPRRQCADRWYSWCIQIGLVVIITYLDPVTMEWGFFTASSSGDGYTYQHQAEAVAERHTKEKSSA